MHMQWMDVAWIAFTIANLAAMRVWADWETVPFHFIWVSLTLLYGFRVWRTGPTVLAVVFVVVATGAVLFSDYLMHAQPIDELTEVPLMTAMFLAMVWHARRRLMATQELKKVSDTNYRLLQREQQFIQDASHELRTPITVALGHAELIQRATKDPMVAEDARVVTDELLRLKRLADRLLLLESTQAGSIHPVPVELDSLVAEALRRWAPTPRRWVLGRADPATVDADPDRISLALDALVENAVEHTLSTDSIELSVMLNGGTATVAVTDSGPGIDPKDLDRIFDRFARADAGRSRERGGLGLGLSIVNAVATAHGGSVRVRSTPGQGSTFELVLPTRPALPTRSDARRSASASTAGPIASDGPAEGQAEPARSG
jgi:signal transduction histidine kinase